MSIDSIAPTHRSRQEQGRSATRRARLSADGQIAKHPGMSGHDLMADETVRAPERKLNRTHAAEHLAARIDGGLHVVTGLRTAEGEHGHLPRRRLGLRPESRSAEGARRRAFWVSFLAKLRPPMIG
jgi:hypothetical protein